MCGEQGHQQKQWNHSFIIISIVNQNNTNREHHLVTTEILVLSMVWIKNMMKPITTMMSQMYCDQTR